jgi:3-oxoacyl-[acyl-carrier-protein] synthase II
MRRRVVITGLGLVIPHGQQVDAVWEQIAAGRGALRKLVKFDPVDMPTQMGGEVLYEVTAPDQVGPYPVEGDAVTFTAGAVTQAVADAGLSEAGDRLRRAVVMATGIGEASLEKFGPVAARHFPEDHEIWRDKLREFYPVMQASPEADDLDGFYLDTAPGIAAVLLGAGQVYNTASACASGSQAIADAAQLVRRGEVDIALAGGVCTAVNRAMIPGFSFLQALSQRNDEPEKASRPFDAGRDGFVMSEGASVLILEDLEHAVARGATIHAELLGYGYATDSYRLTDPEPNGRGMALAMTRAVADAGLEPPAIQYINAHGTSTGRNDAAETKAIKKVFGDGAYDIPVSSSKSMIGHLIHGAGTTEAIFCIKALQTGLLPPTINYEEPDPDCDLDYIPNEAREADVDVVLSNSFGFGGQNVSIVLGTYRD